MPTDRQDLPFNDEVVKVACKKHNNSASEGSPINSVTVAGLVAVQQFFISGLMFTRIDYWG
jgi:hypothetical protein